MHRQNRWHRVPVNLSTETGDILFSGILHLRHGSTNIQKRGGGRLYLEVSKHLATFPKEPKNIWPVKTTGGRNTPAQQRSAKRASLPPSPLLLRDIIR